ncbi:MAG: phage tail tube protein [Pseudomonadota bacterium]
MSMSTQGTKLYFIDPDTDAATAVDCLLSANPGGAPADQLDDTCLEETSGYRTFKRGLKTPGQAGISINADPRLASHVRLFELSQGVADENIKWALGWSDGTDAPTVDSNGDFNLPTTRTWFTFEGYVADFPFDFQLNALVTADVSIQRSGAGVWVPKLPPFQEL